ncbi:hypothetical protein WJX72_000796 [[Myrmecia] bisecta]|uniref:ABC transporter domain-containing protein n=1 Tax=[Myrmecia] bisecta TaxID=41462 RepID=A0AAW1Q1V4_9CHLO
MPPPNQQTRDSRSPAAASAMRRISRLSTSAVRRTVAFLKPSGAEQFTEYVSRSVSLSRQDWERYSQRADPTCGMAEDVLYSAPSRKSGDHHVDEYPARDKGQRSIFGLPLLSPLSQFARVWASFVLTLDLTYVAFIVPITVAFQVSDLAFTWAGIVNLVAGAFYVVELVLGFHIGFVGTHALRRRVIMHGRAVAWYYMRHGTFFVDLITTVAWLGQVCVIFANAAHPVSLGAATPVFQALRVLRLIRFAAVMRRLFTSIGRSSTVLPRWLLPVGAAYFTHILYGGAVLLNLMGCIWNFVALQEGYNNTWVNHYVVFTREYDASGRGYLTPEECRQIHDSKLWLAGVYYITVTIGTIGFGDITPASSAEIIVSVVIQIIGICFFGIFLGAIADLLQSSSREGRRSSMFRGKIANVRRWMKKKQLPQRLREIITSYYGEVWVRQNEVEEESLVFYEMPFAIRAEIAWEQNQSMFQQLCLFQEVPDSLQAIVASLMTPHELGPGVEVCKARQAATCFWLLHEGSIAAVWDYAKEVVLAAPAVIATPSILDSHPAGDQAWPCSYRTMTACTLWQLNLADVAPLLQLRADVNSSLQQSFREWEMLFMHQLAFARLHSALSGPAAKVSGNPIAAEDAGGAAPEAPEARTGSAGRQEAAIPQHAPSMAGLQELLWQLRTGIAELQRTSSRLAAPGQRWGLVGANGAGKTTLLKALWGLEKVDAGKLVIAENVALGYLSQTAVSGSERTVWDECKSAMTPLVEAEAALERAAQAVTDGVAGGAMMLAHAQDLFEAAGGYNCDKLIANVLTGLGFNKADWLRPCSSFSGGWQMRIGLASLLCGPAGQSATSGDTSGLLLLDEPTNHLDRSACSWLATFLRNSSGGVIIVSHDEALLEEACDCIVEVRGQKLHQYVGSYSEFISQRKLRDAQAAAAAAAQAAKIAKLEEFVNRFGAKASKASQAQSRAKQLDKMRDEFVPAAAPTGDGPGDARKVRLVLPPAPPCHHDLLKMEGATVGWGRPDQDPGAAPLLTDLNLKISRGQRVLVVGPNGAGKSSLLKAISGVLPLWSGQLTLGEGAQARVFSQDLAKDLPIGKAALDYVLEKAREVDVTITLERGRKALGSLGLSGSMALQKIGELSGGEKARVALAAFSLIPSNLLLLDEASNHLDAQTITALTTALQEFKGAIFAITHNQAFAASLNATHILRVENGTAHMSHNTGLSAADFEHSTERSSPAPARAPDKQQSRKARAAVMVAEPVPVVQTAEAVQPVAAPLSRMDRMKAKKDSKAAAKASKYDRKEKGKGAKGKAKR